MDIERFLLHAEQSFGLKFDETTLVHIKTIGDFIDYVSMILPRAIHSDEHKPVNDRIMKHLIEIISTVLKCSPSCVSQSTPLAELFPDDTHDNEWSHIGRMIGTKYWPAIKRPVKRLWSNPNPGTFDRPLCTTVGDVVSFLVARYPSLVKSNTEGWDRSEVAEVIQALAKFTFGLLPRPS